MRRTPLWEPGEAWTRSDQSGWTQLTGAFEAGDSLYAGSHVSTGPAGVLVSWQVGYPPGAHQTQSPVLIDRGSIRVYLFQPGMPEAAFVTDQEGTRLLTIAFPEPGTEVPEHIEIDEGDGVVKFLDPDDGSLLAELTFDEIETALTLDEPQLRTWWWIDGASWTEVAGIPIGDLRRVAVGETAVVAASTIIRYEWPEWVARLAGMEPEIADEVWFAAAE